MHERELKFTPGPSFRVPDLSEASLGVRAEPCDAARLVAIYYDTADLRLARAGASLRYREPEGWTVKLPGGDDTILTREELNFGGVPGEPPEVAVDLVHALARSAPLVVVARLITRRERTKLRDRDATALGEVVDDEVSVLDGARLVARFREVEVELTDDTPPTVVGWVEGRLRAAGAGPPQLVPKIVRALGPRASEPPDVMPPPELDHDAGVAEIAQAAVAGSVAQLVARDPGVREGSDPENVHKMRVATRRLRSDLKTFRPVVDRSWSDPLRDELQWLGGLLGDVRDTEVLLDRLDHRLDELPASDRDAGKRLLDSLRTHRETARAALLDGLRSERYLSLLDELAPATQHGALTPDADDDIDPDDLVRRPWRKLRKAVDALDDEPSDPELHEIRKLAKWARYAGEAVSVAVGKPARRFAKRAMQLQDVLGEHQDAVVAEAWLREHGTHFDHDVEVAFVAGELAAVERAAAADARDAWPAAWKRLRRERPSTW